MAASDLLKSLSLQAAESLLTCITILRDLMPADGNQPPLEMRLPKWRVLFAVADKAFGIFVADVGGKARSEWADKPHVPASLQDISLLVNYLKV